MPVRGKTAGNAGKGSKWIGKVRRRRIYARDGHRCVWCGRLAEKLTLDHVVPRSHGGTKENQNLVTACMPCNRLRGNASVIEFAAKLGRPEIAVLRGLLVAMTAPLPELQS
jgi:5-methylcytosine-specific restriction endonuclease McrA